jgi:hypothetical protein
MEQVSNVVKGGLRIISTTYSSDATGLMRPHLSHACLVAPRISIASYDIRPV